VSIVHTIIAPGGGTTDVSTRVLMPDLFTLSSQLNDASPGTGEVVIDDPLGDIELVDGNTYQVEETDSASADPFLGSWSFGSPRIERGPYRTGAGRRWRVPIIDANRGLSIYIFGPDEDVKRPAETAGTRMTWMLGTLAMVNYDDHRYVDTSDTTPMPEADYTDQAPMQVMADCAEQSGHEYGAIFCGDTEQYAPVYLPQSSELLTSDLRLTNDLADLNADTFMFSLDTSVEYDGTRIASRVIMLGDGRKGYYRDRDTEVLYARRDAVANAPNVKSKTGLDARGNRYLRDFGDPMPIISGSVELPAERVTEFKAHHRLQFKATHMSGFQSFTWVRARKVDVELIARKPSRYRVRFELVPPLETVIVPTTHAAAVLYLPHSFGPSSEGALWWAGSGDDPPSGYPGVPTTGLLSIVTDGSPPNPGWQYTGIQVDGDGTITGSFHASIVGVKEHDTTYSATFAVTVNGAIVASEVLSIPATGTGWGGYSGSQTVEFSGVAVSNGDVVSATVTLSPPFLGGGHTVPAGSGSIDHKLEITTASLA
jgi:hypothetical protein